MADESYARAEWVPGDIKTLRPDWTLEKCEEFLNANEKYIRDGMIEHGWGIIESLLNEE